MVGVNKTSTLLQDWQKLPKYLWYGILVGKVPLAMVTSKCPVRQRLHQTKIKQEQKMAERTAEKLSTLLPLERHELAKKRRSCTIIDELQEDPAKMKVTYVEWLIFIYKTRLKAKPQSPAIQIEKTPKYL